MTRSIVDIELFHRNIEHLRKLTGLGKKEFSNLLGVTNAYRKDLASIGDQFWLGIKENFSVPSKDWLITEHDDEEIKRIKFTSRQVRYSSGGSVFELAEEASTDDDFVLIPHLSGKISAGVGLAPENEIHVQVAFRKDWIKKKGSPEQMSLIKVKGDSMEPTLSSGDMILVDHSRNTIDPQGGIYAIVIDDMIMIKRLHVLGTNKIRIVSDNPHYDPIETTADALKINGKVLWFCRELER